MDVLRHASTYGVDPRSGMFVVGDDPAAKLPASPVVSERTLAARRSGLLSEERARDVVIPALQEIALSATSGQ